MVLTELWGVLVIPFLFPLLHAIHSPLCSSLLFSFSGRWCVLSDFYTTLAAFTLVRMCVYSRFPLAPANGVTGSTSLVSPILLIYFIIFGSYSPFAGVT